MEGLRSPTPKEVHLLVAFVAPGLAPRLANARAAVVVFTLWRIGVRSLRFGMPEEPHAQGGTLPGGACGARAGALDRPRTCGRCLFALLRLWRSGAEDVEVSSARVAPRLSRSGGEEVDVGSACGAQRPRRYTSWCRSWRAGSRPGSPTNLGLLSFSRCGSCGEVGVATLTLGRLVEPSAQGGTPPCGVCGARAGA